MQNVRPDTIEGTPPSLEDEDCNKGNHNEVNSTATSQEVEAEFIGADFCKSEKLFKFDVVIIRERLCLFMY